jgi:hypothetical protein
LAKYAPPTLPDEQSLQMLVSQSLPVTDQYKMGFINPPGLTDALARASAPPPGYGGTGATATPATTPPGSGATIGQRQNNPGNLTFAGQPGAQPGQGNRFASFPDMPTGVAATADQLALYQQQHGINTVRGAVTRWVSDPKADLTSYIGDISKALGIGPDDKIDLTNPDVQAKFIQAQFPHESAGGGYVLNPADVAKGVQMAAANRGRAVQAPGTAIATAAQPGATPPPTQYAGPGAPGAPVPPPGPTAALGGPAQPAAPTAAPAQPGQPQPAAAPAATAQPGATPLPGTGVNSQQFQTALWKTQQAALLETQFPNSPAAKAKAAELRAEAALYMQADSVITLPNGIQVKALSGQQVDAAKPAEMWVQQPNGTLRNPNTGDVKSAPTPAEVWVKQPDGTYINQATGKPESAVTPAEMWVKQPDGTFLNINTGKPMFPPTPRGIHQAGVGVLELLPGGGARVVSAVNPQGITAEEAAKTAGAALGTAGVKQVADLANQGRTAAQAIGNIDYGMSQVQKAKAGGINTGYFAPWLSTIGAIAKSIGGDTGAQLLGIDPTAVGNTQTAAKTLAVVSGAILNQILGPESQVTDAKIQHFIHAQPGIETDPDALGRVLNWARTQFVYEREMAAQGMKDAKSSGALPLGWQANYFDQHGFAPIYNPGTGEMQQPEGQAPSRTAPATLSAAPINPAERKIGTIYITKNLGPATWTEQGWLKAQ